MFNLFPHWFLLFTFNWSPRLRSTSFFFTKHTFSHAFTFKIGIGKEKEWRGCQWCKLCKCHTNRYLNRAFLLFYSFKEDCKHRNAKPTIDFRATTTAFRIRSFRLKWKIPCASCSWTNRRYCMWGSNDIPEFFIRCGGCVPSFIWITVLFIVKEGCMTSKWKIIILNIRSI